VEDALEAIARVLKRVDTNYFPDSDIRCSPIVGIVGDAEALVSLLQLAAQADQQRRMKMEAQRAAR
jgi:hypothetical protein